MAITSDTIAQTGKIQHRPLTGRGSYSSNSRHRTILNSVFRALGEALDQLPKDERSRREAHVPITSGRIYLGLSETGQETDLEFHFVVEPSDYVGANYNGYAYIRDKVLYELLGPRADYPIKSAREGNFATTTRFVTSTAIRLPATVTPHHKWVECDVALHINQALEQFKAERSRLGIE